MALASYSQCAHSFVMIKSDNTLIEWRCHDCHDGPFWFIWECRYCRHHTCRTCMDNA
ncbi:hypothetical protein MYCTH_2316167 [Thermothelomyces thermophilus ATCC 42464]|uniref:Uncharacterized protein n=1 Tax=Thermothelomyces thermophilus (strain ATCC 42464 / BCRC 31852 / DSM 1799) TaxID=573729 RepID=G2QKW0_THET4|nr:uncharacterized protein MYCTH_2316167 [Thermothelomyces thermophilus ATCC 42464]AEO60592.1 hypothetical protein MYCTH_2316167 [Thermothelomyces thermophilus ATCC 42464]